jgi:hypothetical protein
MARPRSASREGDLFVTICPKCSRKRLLKSNPGRRRDGICLSCQHKGIRFGPPALALPPGATERYLKGVSALQIATELGVSPSAVLAALRRAGVKTRSMSEAVGLLDTIGLVQARAAELRATGEMSKLMSAGRQGIAPEEWDGFRNDYWQRVRSSKEWADWRTQVYARDGYHCVLCGAGSTRDNPLDPHHIWKKSLYPERVFDVTNGVTLCRGCHLTVNGQEEEWASLFEAMLAEAA